MGFNSGFEGLTWVYFIGRRYPACLLSALWVISKSYACNAWRSMKTRIIMTYTHVIASTSVVWCTSKAVRNEGKPTQGDASCCGLVWYGAEYTASVQHLRETYYPYLQSCPRRYMIFIYLFIYCNFVSARWHWSVDWYKNRQETARKEK